MHTSITPDWTIGAAILARRAEYGADLVIEPPYPNSEAVDDGDGDLGTQEGLVGVREDSEEPPRAVFSSHAHRTLPTKRALDGSILEMVPAGPLALGAVAKTLRATPRR